MHNPTHFLERYGMNTVAPENAISGASANNMKVGNNAVDLFYENMDKYSANPVEVVGTRGPRTSLEIRNTSNPMGMQQLSEVNYSPTYTTGIIDDRGIQEMVRNTVSAGGDLAMEAVNPVAVPTLDSLNRDSMLTASEVPVPEQLKSGINLKELNNPGFSKIPQAAEKFLSSTGVQAGIPIVKNLMAMAGRSKQIDNLEDSRDSIMSSISGMAEQTAAQREASDQSFNETRRSIGASVGDKLFSAIENIRNARTNIVSGTRKQKEEDVLDSARTRTDMAIDDAYTKKLSADAAFDERMFTTRAKAESQLKSINNQISELRRKQAMGPVDMLLDTAQTFAPPGVGLAIQYGRTLIS
tara:strand:+ start:6920 stop:7984 length:1065 start_codon:yes stop_codon:yes gene_type:complete